MSGNRADLRDREVEDDREARAQSQIAQLKGKAGKGK